MDNLNIFQNLLDKAELNMDFSLEIESINREIFSQKKKFVKIDNQITLQNVLSICNNLNFLITTYNIETLGEETFLNDYVLDKKIDTEIEFFNFLKNFTDNGNFVAIKKDFNSIDNTQDKTVQFIYVGKTPRPLGEVNEHCDIFIPTANPLS